MSQRGNFLVGMCGATIILLVATDIFARFWSRAPARGGTPLDGPGAYISTGILTEYRSTAR